MKVVEFKKKKKRNKVKDKKILLGERLSTTTIITECSIAFGSSI